MASLAAELQSLPAPRLAVLVGGTVSRRWWQRPLAPDLNADALVSLLHSEAKVLETDYEGNHVVLEVLVSSEMEGRLRGIGEVEVA